MKYPKIQHFRKNCIGCNACVLIAPQQWLMNEHDGKAILRNSQGQNDVFVADIAEHDLEKNQKAAQACPMNIIKIMNS